MSKNAMTRLALFVFYGVFFWVAYELSVSPIPVEECPPNVGAAIDGTCGIYEKDAMEAFLYTFFLAVLPSILIVDGRMLYNRFKKNKTIEDQVAPIEAP